jgi:hypothetical protein
MDDGLYRTIAVGEEAVAEVMRGLSTSNADKVARGLVTFMSQMTEAKSRRSRLLM